MLKLQKPKYFYEKDFTLIEDSSNLLDEAKFQKEAYEMSLNLQDSESKPGYDYDVIADVKWAGEVDDRRAQFQRSRKAILMSYYEDGDLYGINFKTELEIAKIIKQMLVGALILNKSNIAHNDIKPRNYLIKRVNDEVKLFLSDFGFAHKRNERAPWLQAN